MAQPRALIIPSPQNIYSFFLQKSWIHLWYSPSQPGIDHSKRSPFIHDTTSQILNVGTILKDLNHSHSFRDMKTWRPVVCATKMELC